MSNQKPGSDAVMDSVEVSTVLHSFRLEWKIPSETILDTKHLPRKVSTGTPYDDLLNAGLAEMSVTNVPTMVENSKWFEFKDLKIPPFYLELSCEKCYDGEMPPCRVRVMTKDPNDAMKLNYAIVCRGDRLYRLAGEEGMLGYKEQEATLDVLRGICREQKCVTIACQVTAESDVRSSSVANNDDKMTLECSCPKDTSKRSSSTMTWHSSSAEKAIAKYLASGALPSLNVDLARELLVKASVEKGHAELRALSAEFLMKNLDSENASSVWSFACEHHVQSLMMECGRYMANHWRDFQDSEENGKKLMGPTKKYNQKNFLHSTIHVKKY